MKTIANKIVESTEMQFSATALTGYFRIILEPLALLKYFEKILKNISLFSDHLPCTTPPNAKTIFRNTKIGGYEFKVEGWQWSMRKDLQIPGDLSRTSIKFSLEGNSAEI